MSNQQLLELAAKAADYDVMRTMSGRIVVGFKVWDPLNDDGDAFRLQVDLDIVVSRGVGIVMAKYDSFNPETFEEFKIIYQSVLDDYRASSRLAIVCAAAEIGAAMP